MKIKRLLKDAKVSVKMIVCLALMIIFTLGIMTIGVFGAYYMREEATAMYKEHVLSIAKIEQIREAFQEERVLIQKLAYQDAAADREAIAAIKQEMQQGLVTMDNLLLQYKNSFFVETDAVYPAFRSLYETFFRPSAADLAAASDSDAVMRAEDIAESAEMEQMLALVSEGVENTVLAAEKRLDGVQTLFVKRVTFITLMAFGAFVLSLLFSIYLPTAIAKPIREMVDVADAIAAGDMTVTPDEDDRQDEIGQLFRAMERMRVAIEKQTAVVEALANADLRVEPQVRGEKDILGQSLLTLTDNLNGTISEVAASAQSVAVEADQIAAQSHDLAQGTTEQAASVEELSSAVFEISLNTKENAQMARKAAALSDSVRGDADSGKQRMEELIAAVHAADAASKNIAKIIKVIDEISFQTSILALNAAVEAAHAGQHGSGFAVVAAEVRNLASKSAASARDTGELITDTLEKVQQSAALAQSTAEDFNRIVAGITESTGLVADIAKSSEEQALAIEQITTGIGQVAEVINNNSGAAEKCAESAGRMNEQSRVLEQSVMRFRTRGGQTADKTPYKKAAAQKPAIPEIKLTDEYQQDDFGKY